MNKRSNTFYDKWKKTFGFMTTGTSRELLYGSVLQNAAKAAGHVVNDRVLSEEIRGLVVKNGRIDHSAGGHDDNVIGWLMTHWLLTHGKNLTYYGINTDLMLSRVNMFGKQLTMLEEYEVESQKYVKRYNKRYL